MRKGLKLFLAILTVVSVCASFIVTASAVEAPVSYLGASSYAISDGTIPGSKQPVVKDGKVTFKINMASGLTVTGAMVTVKYDKNVLKIVDAGPAVTTNANGEKTEVITGMHTHGVPQHDSSAYTFAYISANGFRTGDAGKEYAYITFEVINSNYPLTSVEFVAGDYTSTATIKKYTDMATLDTGMISSIVAGNKSISLTWDAVSGATAYDVYRKGGADKGYRKIATVQAITYNDADNIVHNTNYTYAVRAKNANAVDGWYVAKAFNYIDTVNLTVVNDNSGVKISWDRIDGATGYKVFKRTVGQTEWIEVSSVGAEVLTVTDVNISSGVSYEYTACALKGESSSALAQVKSVQYVAIVSDVKLKNAAKGVNVSWTAVPGAEQYRVYRKLTGENDWTLIHTVASTVLSVVDTGAKTGATNYYAVLAYSNGTWSSYKSYAVNYIATPQITKTVSEKGSGITLEWGAVEGAAKYRVYRASDDGKKWILLKTVTGTSYVDKDVDFGKSYKYTLRAENGKNLSGYNTKGWTVQYTLTTPTLKKISASNSGITLKWGKIDGADGYKVYRALEGDKKWTLVANVSGTSYTDANVTAGVKYKYTLRAYSNSAVSDYHRTGWAGAVLAQPTVTIANYPKGVRVFWSPVEGAEGYTVYRSQYDEATGKWSAWKNMGTAKSTSKAAKSGYWTDKKTVGGVTYKYTVRAVAGLTKSPYKESNSLIYLVQPTVKISNVANGMGVKWSKVDKAEAYTVYRSQYDETVGKWTKWQVMGTAKATSKAAKSGWTDKNVVDGVTYRYTVRAVKGDVLSGYTGTKGLMFLKVPGLVSCVKTAEGVVLTYEQNPKADSYSIYRRTADTKWVLIETVSGTSNVVYTDKTAVNGTQYIYTVRALNGKSVSYYNKTGITVTA